MKTYAIARNTFSEAIHQPIVYLIAGLGVTLLLLSFAFTLFTFSEENTARMIRDMGLATITLCALLAALFTSSSVIADEIEKKTALTVLCKPVTRFQFLLGKYLGILLLVFCMIAVLMILFLVALLFLGPKADIGASRVGLPTVGSHLWFVKHKADFILCEAGLFSFLQVAILTAISIAISTRFPLVVNVSACFLIYVAGHVNTYVVAMAQQKGAMLRTCAQIFATIFPNLENLNVAALAAKGMSVSISCLAFCALYAVVYVVAVLALALIALERRELM